MNSVIEHFGNQQTIARTVGVSQQRVSTVMARGIWPAKWVVPLCKASNWTIRPHDLRPDLYPDEDWIPKQDAAA